MENISHKNKWNIGTVQVHVYPPPIPLIKNRKDEKSDRDSVKIKFNGDPTSEKFYIYEFKMNSFDNDNPEELLLFIHNFNMTLEESETIKSGAKIQYLFTLVRG